MFSSGLSVKCQFLGASLHLPSHLYFAGLHLLSHQPSLSSLQAVLYLHPALSSLSGLLQLSWGPPKRVPLFPTWLLNMVKAKTVNKDGGGTFLLECVRAWWLSELTWV